jgi:hypothetical protein
MQTFGPKTADTEKEIDWQPPLQQQKPQAVVLFHLQAV